MSLLQTTPGTAGKMPAHWRTPHYFQHAEIKPPVENQVSARHSKAAPSCGDNARPRVAILMCTFNGALFLREQLDSFETQSFPDWTLYVSDDGSTDATTMILQEYQKRWVPNKLILFQGPQQGFAQNFLSLLRRQEIKADYFAFSDQDDVWYTDKLDRGIASLRGLYSEVAGLFCTRTRLINEQREAIGYSPAFSKPPSFQNALVQSIAGANTMLINSAARNILAQIPADAQIIAHDWLAYLLISGCGGVATYDPRPSLDYRQHANNIIGSNSTWRDRVRRLAHIFSGQRKLWTDANLRILESITTPLTCEAQKAVLHFKRGRCVSLPARLCEIRKSGVYRQTFAGTLSLYIAACLGKV